MQVLVQRLTHSFLLTNLPFQVTNAISQAIIQVNQYTKT